MRLLGTFGSLTTARLGMYASQQGLNVTGHNITNINTQGYTRQRLDQMALRIGGNDRFAIRYGANSGSGVLCTGISQIRDPFLDIRFRNEQTKMGSLDAKMSGLEDLSRILDELSRSGDAEGVMEAEFKDLKAQFQSLSSNLGQDDNAVAAAAKSLASLFNDYAKQLETVHENQATGFQDDLDTVNTILKNISELNTSIMTSEVHGDSAPELRDQRNLLIDQLSQYANITVEYQTVSVGGGETAESLSIYLSGTNFGDPTTSRSPLVDGKYCSEFSIRQVPVDPTDPNSPMQDSPNFDLDLAPLVDAKGNALDPNAVTVQLGDNDLYGALQSTREILTEAGEFTDADVIPIDANAAIKRGIPYYQKSLDALAQKFADVMNTANEGYLKDSDGNFVNSMGESLGNVWNETVRDTGVKLGGPLFSTSSDNNDKTGITAANISISKGWSTGDVEVVKSFVMMSGVDWGPDNPARPGSTDTSNLMHFLTLFDDKQDFSAGAVNPDAYQPDSIFFTGSFQDMLGNINFTLANDINDTSVLLNNAAATSNMISTGRDSVSGVDLNDETTNLMQYQKSFSAACRLMTTMDEALDKLINGTGIVGR